MNIKTEDFTAATILPADHQEITENINSLKAIHLKRKKNDEEQLTKLFKETFPGNDCEVTIDASNMILIVNSLGGKIVLYLDPNIKGLIHDFTFSDTSKALSQDRQAINKYGLIYDIVKEFEHYSSLKGVIKKIFYNENIAITVINNNKLKLKATTGTENEILKASEKLLLNGFKYLYDLGMTVHSSEMSRAKMKYYLENDRSIPFSDVSCLLKNNKDNFVETILNNIRI